MRHLSANQVTSWSIRAVSGKLTCEERLPPVFPTSVNLKRSGSICYTSKTLKFWFASLFTAVLLLTILSGYFYLTQKTQAHIVDATTQVTNENTSLSISPNIEETTTELPNLAQLLAIPYDFDKSRASKTATLSLIEVMKPGFVVIFGQRISAQSASDEIQSILNQTTRDEQPLITIDHEGGRVQRLNGPGFSYLPDWYTLCKMDTYQRGEVLARSAIELKKIGINIVFAPVVDVAKSNSSMGDRVCDDDPVTVTSVALEFIHIFAQQEITSVLKHFPGTGSINTDIHFSPATALITSRDTQPFTSILKRYPELGVMVTHIVIKNQTSMAPCSLSVECIDVLLQHYPDVVVYSDAIEMSSARYNPQTPGVQKPIEEIAVEAVLAGNSVVILGRDVTPEELMQIQQRFVFEYQNSETFKEKADQALTKIRKLRTQHMP